MSYFNKILASSLEPIYSILRIITGFLFLWHGAQKLFNLPVDFPYTLSSLTQVAGLIELIGGAFVMFGFMTRPLAFLCSGTMAVAYWMVHGMNSFFPMINGGELAALYCFVFLLISSKGPGIWSIDSLFISDSESEAEQ